MLEKLLASKLVHTLNTGEEEKEIYEYGLSAIISTVLTTIVLFTIGVILHHVLETFIYIIVFTVLRSQCGGYHAPTRVICIVVSSVGLLLVLYVFPHINRFDIILLASLLGMAILSPVDSLNKPIHKSKRIGFKIRSVIILVIFSCIAIIWSEMMHIIALTIMWVVILMICQVIIKEKAK